MKIRERKVREKRRFGSLLGVLFCFIGLAVFIFAERSGIQYEADRYVDPYLSGDLDVGQKEAGEEKECLVIFNSESEESMNAKRQFDAILLDMRIGYDSCDLRVSGIPDLEPYETSVVLVSDLELFGESILTLCSWVEGGGNAMFALPIQKGVTSSLVAPKLGIAEMGYDYATVDSFTLADGFMIGGNKKFAITDPYPSSASVTLDEGCEVYARSGDGRVPLIWTNSYGEGKFVLDNLGFFEKAYRGLYASSYSLLKDICIYPVINGSSFYIDDFPSPVPQGNGTYIRRDYNRSIADFYSNIWWPDMMKLAKKYGMTYTGMIIENYEAQTSGELPRNGDISRYQFFGNMLLGMGGELGFHGYNHQPLCLPDFDYENEESYTPWEDKEEMERSVEELRKFSSGIFPEENFSVYVPPSNILSDAGRDVIADEASGIRAIASIYLPGLGEPVYEQEFEVAEDGIVETPRVISGCTIDSYMEVIALCELNFHFINSHFLHPDDLLDVDRGAAKGWEKLKGQFESYLGWLHSSAPDIRPLTGSQMAGAVQRWSAVSLWSLDTQEEFYLTVDNLYDEAYFMIRVNEGAVGNVTGGELEHLTGNLYLLRATENEIVIERNR